MRILSTLEKMACENSGHIVSDDFPEVRKIVDAGVTNKPIKDYESVVLGKGGNRDNKLQISQYE